MNKNSIKKAIIESADNNKIKGVVKIEALVKYDVNKSEKFKNATEIEKKIEIKKRIKRIKKVRIDKLRELKTDRELLKEFKDEIYSEKIMKKAKKLVDIRISKDKICFTKKEKQLAIYEEAKNITARKLSKIKIANKKSIDKQNREYDRKVFEELNQSNLLNSLIDYHLKKDDAKKTETLLLIFKYIEIEDTNKKLTLTNEQYKEWLNISGNHYINTNQCEVLYGLSKKQQQGLRSKMTNALQVAQLDTKHILYERKTIEEYLENYITKSR